MLKFVAQNDAPDVFSFLFIFELCGVDTDHHELIRILRFKSLEIGNDVHAVNAAVSPEVEQNNFPLQCCEGQWAIGIQPTAAAGKLRRANSNAFLLRHGKTFHRAS
jgi:hypothetical protein